MGGFYFNQSRLHAHETSSANSQMEYIKKKVCREKREALADIQATHDVLVEDQRSLYQSKGGAEFNVVYQRGEQAAVDTISTAITDKEEQIKQQEQSSKDIRASIIDCTYIK